MNKTYRISLVLVRGKRLTESFCLETFDLSNLNIVLISACAQTLQQFRAMAGGDAFE